MDKRTLRRLLIAWAMVGATTGVGAAPRSVTPHSVGTQDVVYEHGRAFVVSRGQRATVILSPEAIDSKRVWATLTFVNTGDRSFLVGETPLQGQATTTGGTKALVILGKAALEKKEKRRQMWEGLAVGLTAGLNSYAASQQGYSTSTTYHQGSVSAYGTGGYAHANYSGTAVTHTYDAAAAGAAMAQASQTNANMLGNLAAEQQARSNALNASVLNNHTLEPGQEYSGRVQLELPRKNRREGHVLSLVVHAGGESHPFLLIADAAADPSVLSHAATTLAQQLPAPKVWEERAASPTAQIEQEPAVPAAPLVADQSERIARLEAELAAARRDAASATTSASPTAISAPTAPVQMALPAKPTDLRAPRDDGNSPFYLISSNTARHRASGIDWRVPSGGTRPWSDATATCKSLGAGWRLASAGELKSLGTSDTRIRCGSGECQAPAIFGRLEDAWVWSEETDGNTKAYAMSLATGAAASLSMHSVAAIALCARSPSDRG